MEIESAEAQLRVLRLLVLLLPDMHAETLDELLRLLAVIATRTDENKMSSSNLAVVLAPTLFFVPGRQAQRVLSEIKQQGETPSVVRRLIDDVGQLWLVPAPVMEQLRYIHAARACKTKPPTPAEAKKLLAQLERDGVAGGSVNRAPPSEYLRWETAGGADGVRARVRVIMPLGAQGEFLPVYDHSTVATLLEHALDAAAGKASLIETGGNIGALTVCICASELRLSAHPPRCMQARGCCRARSLCWPFCAATRASASWPLHESPAPLSRVTCI